MSTVNHNDIISLIPDAASLLRDIVAISSFSGLEEQRCNFLSEWIESKGLFYKRLKNNLIAFERDEDSSKPVLLLNSHIDTVKPGGGYTFDPFTPPLHTDKILGLGSNDAGASVVSMLYVYLYLSQNGNLPFNLKLLLSAQEENSGPDGISYAIKEAGRVDAAVIGEPTCMKAAVAERGLLVIDGFAYGESGHAARDEGVNSIYLAMEDIDALKRFKFSRISPLMGEVKLSVTQIEAGTQHNVVPDICHYVVDIRPTDLYNNAEIVQMLSACVKGRLKPRNLSNRSSATPNDHPLIKAAQESGKELFISPTTSDWMRLNVPALKMGPGDSSRSHRADEYVFISEIEEGIKGYISFLEQLNL